MTEEDRAAIARINAALARLARSYVVLEITGGCALLGYVIWTLASHRWQLAFVGIIGLLSLVSVLDNSPFRTRRLLHAGLVVKPRAPFVVSVEDHSLSISAFHTGISIPLNDISGATFFFLDSTTETRGLADVLHLQWQDSLIRIPSSADGFQALLQWLEQRDQLQRIDLQ